MKRWLISICVFCLPALRDARAQEAVWPSARSTHVMAWHAGLRQVVLLGGAAEDSALWGWNGTRWQVPAARPDAATLAMVYDSARDRLVVQGGAQAVFGTREVSPSGDTWEWSRSGWRRVAESGGPVCAITTP